MHKVDPELRPFYVDVYMALREAWREHGQGPSQYELMLACKCSGTTVINALRALRKKGYISAPKFGYRQAKPTNLDLTLSREPLDPWAEPEDELRFWRRPRETA